MGWGVCVKAFNRRFLGNSVQGTEIDCGGSIEQDAEVLCPSLIDAVLLLQLIVPSADSSGVVHGFSSPYTVLKAQKEYL